MALPVPPAPTSIPATTPTPEPPPINAAPPSAGTPPPPQAAPAPAPAPAAAPAPVQAAPAPAAAPAPVQAAPAPVQAAPAPAAAPAPVPAAPAPAAAPVPAAQVVSNVPAAPAAPQQMAAPQETAMAAAPQAGGGLSVQAAAAGFEGLDFGFGACPVVSLKTTGRFKTTDDVDLGTEFMFRMMNTRNKFLFATDLPQTDPRNEAVYSYDKVTNSNNGKPIQEYKDKWAAAGISCQEKIYLEVEAVMADNTMALLSIPSSGIRRLSKAIGNMHGRGIPFEEMANHWLRAFVGAEVKNVAVPFLPWDFSIPDA